MGEETGGCYYGATGGNYIDLILPGSKLEVKIPTIRIFTAVNEDYITQPKGRGTIPHFEVIPNIQDVLYGKDVQLEKLCFLLKKSFLQQGESTGISNQYCTHVVLPCFFALSSILFTSGYFTTEIVTRLFF